MKKFNFENLAGVNSELSLICVQSIQTTLDRLRKGDFVDKVDFVEQEDFAITYYGYADKIVNELGVFNCINLILAAYNGSRFKKFDSVNVANACAVIFGVVLVSKSQHYQSNQNSLSPLDCDFVEDELQTYLESLTEDFSNVVFDEYGV